MLKEKEKEPKIKEVAPWRPFSELARMEREMEQIFDDSFGRPWGRFFGMGWPRWLQFWEDFGYRGPAIDMYDEKDNIVVKAEVPGLKKEDLEVTIKDNLLTIKGQKQRDEELKDKGYYYSERSYGSFERCIEIPREVQTDKARSSFKDGILEVRIPKTEEAKRKEVELKIE
jgi:HSP20 family protein